MNHDSRLSSARQRASSVRGALGFLFALSLPLSAQTPRVVVSTTDDLPVTAGLSFPVTDGDLVAAGGGSAPAPFFMGGHFEAAVGFVPGDIDAFTRLPGARPGTAESLVFSLLSNEAGFLDGDILAVKRGGGTALLVSELEIATALGAPSANLDVDALTFDDQGRILFSLSDNLTGTTLGTVADGDILRLEPGPVVTRVFSEADVQTRFTQATGLTDAILDVLGLEIVNGETWVSVQSPSSMDGAVIRISGTPQVVIDEATMGLGGAEIDALGPMRTGDEIPSFQMSLEQALPGDVVHVEARGRPGALCLVLMAGKSGFVDFARHPGFGAWYLDRHDPWFLTLQSTHTLPVVLLNGSGQYAVDWRLPSGTEFGLGLANELGWSFQMVDVGTLELSAPCRVQKL